MGPDPAFGRLDGEELVRGHLISLWRERFSDPAGAPFTREVVHHPGAVAVLPLHDDGTVTVVRQYRPAVGRYVVEIPAGTCDVHGEDRAVTARRELAEEVGLAAADLEHLVAVYNSPGFCDQRTDVFLATGLTPVPSDPAGVEEEWMVVERVTLADLATAPGAVVDGTTALAAALVRARRPG